MKYFLRRPCKLPRRTASGEIWIVIKVGKTRGRNRCSVRESEKEVVVRRKGEEKVGWRGEKSWERSSVLSAVSWLAKYPRRPIYAVFFLSDAKIARTRDVCARGLCCDCPGYNDRLIKKRFVVVNRRTVNTRLCAPRIRQDYSHMRRENLANTSVKTLFFLPLFIEPPEQGQQQKCGGDGSVAIGEYDDAPPAITFHNPPTTAILRPSPATPCYQLASISTRSRYRSDRNISIPLRVGKSPHSEI